MILKANVGVGIKGNEGNQAERASDYSITKFKDLTRLILYHGRESYRKNCNVVLFNFYKNFLMILVQFWVGALFNGFSGLFIYDVYIF